MSTIVPVENVQIIAQTVTVSVMCPECHIRTGFPGMIHFQADFNIPLKSSKFQPCTRCPNCGYSFPEGIEPPRLSLQSWQMRLRRQINQEAYECYLEEAHRYIPPGSRQAEKKNRARKERKIQKGFNDYLMEGA